MVLVVMTTVKFQNSGDGLADIRSEQKILVLPKDERNKAQPQAVCPNITNRTMLVAPGVGDPGLAVKSR